MASKLANLEAKAEKASTKKGKLGMDPQQSLQLRATLLKIHKVSMHMFDVLEADEISQQDIFTFLQLVPLVNKFTMGMENHAKEVLSKPLAEKTSH